MRTAGLRFRTKIILHATLATLVALVLAAIGFVSYDRRMMRRALVDELRTVANHVGAACAAAIRFDDAETATAQLELFRDNRHILAAVVYHHDGRVLAQYPRAPEVPRRAAVPEGVEYEFESRHLVLLHPITQGRERIGAVLLKRDLTDLAERLWRYAGIVAAVLAMSLLVSVLTTTYLQGVLTRPIRELVATASAVSEKQDFALRARRVSGDELGLLTDAFNDMLCQIERRDGELEQHRLHLEELVQDRTRSLEAKTRELARTNWELARSNVELQQFAFVSSHDLQEPLRKVQAFGDLLQTKHSAALDAEGRDYLDRMRNAAARMRELIDGLLAYSRVTRQSATFATVDLKPIAQDAVADLAAHIRRVEGRVEIGELPALDADRRQMRQLLRNLIDNGLKFHQPGLPPVVEIAADLVSSETRGLVPSGGGGAWCSLTVKDNGIGFEEKYLDRIFTPYERLHSRDRYEGTGMGLAICRKIVELHGGSITAHSVPGCGATFVVTLPVRQAAAAAKTEPIESYLDRKGNP